MNSVPACISHQASTAPKHGEKLGLAAGCVLLGWLLVAPPTLAASNALEEGNRLFRQGQLVAAMEAYAAGYSPRHPDPVLAYNLGTTAHHLGRLPEAVLWYRRAARLAGGDRWLKDNLELARQSLGNKPLWPPGPPGWFVRHRLALQVGGVLLAWAALGALLIRFPSDWRWGLALALASVAAAVFASGYLGLPGSPRAAVLLQACEAGSDPLPAGSEVWVGPDDSGWRISGKPDGICPEETVALVEP
jgi:tetratricopeptide (TPR) repeat protein